jgi:hypothetical protein
MKRVFFIMLAITLSSVTLLTSCTDDTTENLPPSIEFVAGANFISDDATLTVNTPFVIKVLAEENATSTSKLKSLKITRVFNLQTWDTTFTFSESTYTFEAGFTAQATEGPERIEFKVTDNDGQSATIDLQITTQIVASPIDTWEMRILGSWANLDIGSSFASINGNVYMLDEAYLNQNLIDFMYWWGESTSATIGAPNDANAALVFNTGTYQLNNWNTRNETKFKTTTLTTAQFDAVDNSTGCIENATGANQTRIGTLAVNQVIAFISVGGKHGLIRVKEIVAGSDGQITIDVKVQK